MHIAEKGVRIALALLVLLPVASAKRKDDVIIMKNGDRLTGEIKRLEEGKLVFSASYMAADVSVDWSQVERLETKDEFSVYLTGGGAHTGVISKKSTAADASPSFSIYSGTGEIQAFRNEVVVVRPVEDSPWKQLTGSVDYGYSYTGGNNATTQSSLSAAVAYRVEKWWMETNGSSVFNAQSEGTSTGRNTFSFLYARKLTDRWYAAVLSELLNSRQQDLTLRVTTGVGLGRVLLRTERTSVRLLSGVLFSREDYTNDAGAQPRANNAEALFQLRYDMYRFKKLDVSSIVYAYPSLTDQGRVRTGLQASLGVELFRNFKWKFNLYENFDSRPPVHAPRNDFGTGTSVGWTF
jgi:putative salt-induced outer membrane protein YdiY